jgi:hypothetical protein
MELADAFRATAARRNKQLIGTEQLVLVEMVRLNRSGTNGGIRVLQTSKRSSTAVTGKTDGGVKVNIENDALLPSRVDDSKRPLEPGDYVRVRVGYWKWDAR